jgi:Tfp pilus assembly protein PilV
MKTSMQNSRHSIGKNSPRQSEAGVSMLELVVAMVVLTIGLMGVASAIGYALMASNSGRGVTNAKLLVVSVLEQMETLRDTGQLHFDQIANTTNGGPFLTGFQRISNAPGADFIFGTADDPSTTDFPSAKRRIVITDLSSTLKKIEVTVSYSPNGGTTRELVGVSYLNDDAHGNYIH